MPSTTASTPKELVRSLVELSEDLDEARRAVAERDVVRLMAVTRRRQEHAAAAVLTLESSIVREWVASQETEPRITAVEQVVQLIVGKNLVGELVIERSEVLFVQVQPDLEDPQRGAFIFDCIGGPRDESYTLYHFVMSHSMEGASGQHAMLKH